MLSVVIVAEKPSVGRDIANALGVKGHAQGYLHNDHYKITWAIGHLLRLAQPDEMNSHWKSWRAEDLPLLPESWPLLCQDSTKDQYRVVEALLNAPETKEVICATDAGREGELIFRYLYEKSGAKAPVKRLWISSLTPEAIKRGMSQLKPGEDYDSLADAAKGRSRADWLVGMNLSRAYSIAYNEHFSVGRVQTPTLSILASRETEIRSFKAEDYWEIKGEFHASGEKQGVEVFQYDAQTKRHYRYQSEEEAQQALSRLSGQDFFVKELEDKENRIAAPLLYDLTELQRHCNRLFGFKSQTTLSIAQSLYESKKLISYPRTDSRHLSEDVAKGLGQVVDSLVPRYRELMHANSGSPLGHRFVDDSQVTDHHAIIPTGYAPKALSRDEERVFDLICRRLLMAWHDPYRYSTSQLLVAARDPAEEAVFQAKGKRVLDLGWKCLELSSSEGKDRLLPSYLAKSLPLLQRSMEKLKKQTQAPPRITEASLLTAMETAGRKLEDKDLSQAMRERGLGTPATRASIIETLVQRQYVERQGKQFGVTEKGMRLIEILHPDVKSPKLTGEWEYSLLQVQKGKMAYDEFYQGIEDFVSRSVGAVLSEAPERTRIQPPVSIRGVHLAPSLTRERVKAKDLRALLKETFKFDRFRPYQEDVCRDIVRGSDALLVMPTGAGKSLCYHLPGIALGGSTLVISPLIALMDDQVEKLKAFGIKADAIHSGKGRQESRELCRRYLEGDLDFLYIAPERLGVPGFVSLLAQRKPQLVAIDEAHCISQWGHDFRPDYRMLKDRLEGLRPSVFVAMTATATPRVQRDIIEQLGLKSAAVHSHGFRRTNIAIECVEIKKSQRVGMVAELLSKEKNLPAIIYAPTRKQAEESARALGDRAEVYHAGMSAERRASVQRRFLAGELEVIVATIAFGMGIDKANVRLVVHLAFPGSMEGYYQEIGRAGRDGKLSRAVMFFSYADFKTHEFFHKKNYPERLELKQFLKQIPEEGMAREALRAGEDQDIDRILEQLWVHGALSFDKEDKVHQTGKAWEMSYEAQRQHRLSQLREVSSYAGNQGHCRMLQLMEHFGDPDAKGSPCGICDICSPADAQLKTLRPLEPKERRHLQKIMSCLNHDSYLAVGTLYRKHMESAGLSRQELEDYLDVLMRHDFVGSEERVFQKDGKDIPFRVLFKIRALTEDELDRVELIHLPQQASKQKRAGASAKKRKPKSRVEDIQYDESLFDDLKEWRLSQSRKTGVPAFRVLTDRSLKEIAAQKPQTEEELMGIHGLGAAKFAKFGKALLKVLSLS